MPCTIKHNDLYASLVDYILKIDCSIYILDLFELLVFLLPCLEKKPRLLCQGRLVQPHLY